MDILRNLRRLESRLAATVDEATKKITPPGPREPLQILHAIVEDVERRIEPAGRGKYVFPFNRIRISVAADTSETRARFDAVWGTQPSLQDRIIERLRASDCDWTGLNVTTTYADRSEGHWMAPDFHIEFHRITVLVQAKPQTIVVPQNLKLTVVQGTTDRPAYDFTAMRINLGRCPEVRDGRNRLIRTNHVVFAENAGEPNLTVSRNHAHIERLADTAEFRLFDDRSAHGTSLLRNGKTIAVPAGSRGVRLQTGDEIMLGHACLHVEFEARS